MNRKKEFFEQAVSIVAAELNRKGHMPFLVGGWAVNFHGVVRATLDFDLMILEDDYEIASSAFHGTGYELAVKTDLYARYESEKSLITYIDCLFTNRRTYDIMSKEGKIVDICGSNFILPTAKHIVAMKLHAVKYGEGHRRGKDFDDIVELIKANDIDYRSDEFASWCLKFGDADILQRIKDEIS